MPDEDDIPVPPSPWPLVGLHGIGGATHLLAGATAIGFALMGPTWHPLMGDPGSTPRIWGSALLGFATVCALFFSTVATLMAYRLVSAFLLRSSKGTQRLGLVGGFFLAHCVGCIAGVGGAVVGVAGTFFGEHDGPFDTVEATSEPSR